MNEAKTIAELREIDGAFDEGNMYECVYAPSSSRIFLNGAIYPAVYLMSPDAGNVSTFKLVSAKEEKPKDAPRIPFDLERALAGDRVVDINGDELNQFSVIIKSDNHKAISYHNTIGDYVCTVGEEPGNNYLKPISNKLISYYNTKRHDVSCAGECMANKNLFMAPKMGKGFVNVHPFGMGGILPTRDCADSVRGAKKRVMCIDLSQFPEGYGL